MDYRRRITYSAVASFVIHTMLLILVAWRLSVDDSSIGMAAVKDDRPLVLNLEPPRPPRRLIDTAVPAQGPVSPDTDLISDQASKAADPTDVDSGANAPGVEQLADYDDLGGGQRPAAEPAPETPRPREAPREQAEQAQAQPKPEVPERTQVAALRQEEPLPPQPAQRPQPEQAALPPGPVERDAEPKGRVEGGVKGENLLAFEAHRDELAPYLLKVRHAVENRWKVALQLRYSGTAATEAVLDCAISPDGTLSGVEIVKAGESPTYAVLCKKAVEEAAPFGPFPFEVPEIYRTKNIEIRWTFSFFM